MGVGHVLHAPTRAKRGRLESDKHNLVWNALKTSVSFREGYCKASTEKRTKIRILKEMEKLEG